MTVRHIDSRQPRSAQLLLAITSSNTAVLVLVLHVVSRSRVQRRETVEERGEGEERRMWGRDTQLRLLPSIATRLRGN